MECAIRCGGGAFEGPKTRKEYLKTAAYIVMENVGTARDDVINAHSELAITVILRWSLILCGKMNGYPMTFIELKHY